MEIKFGVNTGFLVNRWVMPEQWVPLLAEMGIHSVQFTADMLNPAMPEKLWKRIAEETRNYCEKYKIEISSTFTGAFTRLNHFSHPDQEVREYWIQWFYQFADLSALLGSQTMGSHFGILTVPDVQDEDKKNIRFRENLSCWCRVAEYAKTKGLKRLSWEPMSIAREYGENLEQVAFMQKEINKSNMALPFQICLDVDHGDVASPKKEDTDPYIYLKTFAKDTCQVHLKQSYANKGGHWPFTKEHNEKGKIIPSKVVETLQQGGADNIELILELSFRERTPAEKSLIKDVRESIAYWQESL